MSEINSESPGIGRRIAAGGGPARRAAAVVTVVAVAAGGLAGCRDAVATITRLTVGAPGPDAYTLVANTDRPGTTPRRRAGGRAFGDTPGLYGGTRNTATCDPDRLLAFLRENPAKARAWAGVHRIAVTDLPRYIRKLTPVILRVDTLVTNHGYRNGKATSFLAVLQAGVAVLVDEYGKPVVKCNCGNPLTPPDARTDPRRARYTGPSWQGFAEDKVTVIRPRDRSKGALPALTLVDPDATMSFVRPLGTTGEQDGPPAPPPEEDSSPTGSPTDGPTPTDGPGDTGVPSPAPGSETPPAPVPSTPAPVPGGSDPRPRESDQIGPEPGGGQPPDTGQVESAPNGGVPDAPGDTGGASS